MQWQQRQSKKAKHGYIQALTMSLEQRKPYSESMYFLKDGSVSWSQMFCINIVECFGRNTLIQNRIFTCRGCIEGGRCGGSSDYWFAWFLRTKVCVMHIFSFELVLSRFRQPVYLPVVKTNMSCLSLFYIVLYADVQREAFITPSYCFGCKHEFCIVPGPGLLDTYCKEIGYTCYKHTVCSGWDCSCFTVVKVQA